MPPKKKSKRQKIDWDNIEIEVVSATEPNPSNPYSEWTPEQRRERTIEILSKAIVRRIR